MRRVKLKQGTLAWEKARETRIGSSEIFDIVKYYASDEELQNCGINAESFRAEKPYTTVWALYHKMLGDGFYKRKTLPIKYAEYGHIVEPYGVRILQKGRQKKLRPGEVWIDDKLIASLDIAGVAEAVDIIPFKNGCGTPKIGQRFVCEQKTMMPQIVKNGVPYKYVIQAQYQITQVKADFYILQLMVLNNFKNRDVENIEFIMGKICGMPLKKRYQYLDENLSVSHYYFKNNEHLSSLIKECIKRFLSDIENRNEPTPCITNDSKANVVECLMINGGCNKNAVAEYDLSLLIDAKNKEKIAKKVYESELQKVLETAVKNNACYISSPDGTTGNFIKGGSFRTTIPEVTV